MTNENINIEKILRNIVLGALFIIPFVPMLVSSSMFFPFITGKNFLFRILVEIALFSWALLVVYDRKYLPKRTEILSSVGAFVLVITAADFLGLNLYKSFWSNYERMEGLVSLLHILGYFVLLVSIFTEKLWRRYFNLIFLIGVYLMVYSFFQLAGKADIHQGSTRIDTSFGNSAYFAVHALYLAFLGAIFYFRNLSKSLKWFYGIFSVIYAILVIETMTRGTAIGLVGGMIVASSLVFLKGEEKYRKTAQKVLGAIVIALIVFVGVRNTDFIKKNMVLDRFASLISVEALKNQPRYLVWNMAYQGFKEHPILGWGQENFNLVFNENYDPKMWGQELWFDRAHNVFFDWLIAGGLLGLLSYLSIFFFTIKNIWKKDGMKSLSVIDKSLFTGLLAGYFFHNFFVFDNLMSYIMFFTVVAYINYEFLKGESFEKIVTEKKAEPLSEDNNLTYAFVSVIIIGFFFTMYFVNIAPINASKTLIYALSSQDLNRSLEYFNKVLNMKTFGGTEATEQLVQKAISVIRAQQGVDVSVKQNYFQLAKDAILKKIDQVPNDARYRVFASSLFSSFGLRDEAFAQVKKASELSPNKQAILFELAGAYINNGDQRNAFETGKKAFELEPNYDEARIIYAVTAIYTGQNKLAEDLLAEKFGTTTIITDDRIINAYAQTGQYVKVINIWKARIAEDPNNPQYHVNLSASYLANKERNKSIEELKKAAELNPQFKDQAEYYIKEIKAGRNP